MEIGFPFYGKRRLTSGDVNYKNIGIKVFKNMLVCLIHRSLATKVLK